MRFCRGSSLVSEKPDRLERLEGGVVVTGTFDDCGASVTATFALTHDQRLVVNEVHDVMRSSSKSNEPLA